MNIFRTLWQSIKDLFEELFALASINVLWALINLPLALCLIGAATVGIVPIVIVLLVGVLTFGPANNGLYAVAERISEGRTISWRDFIAGVRENPVFSWKLYGLWMIGMSLILVNLQFYNLSGTTIGSFLFILFLYLAIVWFGMLMYIGPLMRLQSDKRIRIIARNAALMTFGRPLFTLATLLLMGIITAVSIWLPLLLIIATFSFLAIWSFRATLVLIAEADARRLAAEEKARAGSIRANTDKGRSGQIRPRE